MVLTANLWVMMGITLVVGFLFGMFVANAGKYKRLLRAERREHERAVREYERTIKGHDVELKARDERIAIADERIAELERSRTVAPGFTAAATPLPRETAADGRDRLSAIEGMAPRDEVVLNEAGYYRYDQIAKLTGDEEQMLESRLGLVSGTIAKEDWRGQARALERGTDAEDAPARTGWRLFSRA